jgi:hypothetical protein
MPDPYKTCWRRNPTRSSKLYESQSSRRNSSIVIPADDAAHRVGIDRIRTRNRQMPLTVRQDDVFALTNDPEANLLKRPNGFQVRDAGKVCPTPIV